MCHNFQRGQKVKFQLSPFLIRTVGFLASVQSALAKDEVFEVTRTSEFLGDQYLIIKNSAGEFPFGSLNAHLFAAVKVI